MKKIIADLKTQHKNKTRDIFLLANNFHSIDGGDFETEDKKILTSKLLSDWEKYKNKLIENGHEPIDLVQVQSLSDAHDIAYLVLNTKEQIKKKYGF